MNPLHKMQDYLPAANHGHFSEAVAENVHPASHIRDLMEMPLMRPWRLLLKHVNVKKKRSFFTSKKCQETAEAETNFNGTIKDTLAKNRSAREIRQDRDHEGGGLGDDGGRLLQGAPRSPRRSTETPERALSELSQQNTATRSTQ